MKNILDKLTVTIELNVNSMDHPVSHTVVKEAVTKLLHGQWPEPYDMIQLSVRNVDVQARELLDT